MTLNILIVAGTGTFSIPIVREFLKEKYKEKFKVSILIRKETLETTDPVKAKLIEEYKSKNAKLIPGDVMKDSVEELAEKLKGYDVVISVLGSNTPKLLSVGQKKLVEAAIQAGIKWFIPSEFGFDYANIPEISLFGDEYIAKIETRKTLKESKMKWTIVPCGMGMNFILYPGTTAGIDFKNKIITAPGSFDYKLTLTSLEDLAALLALIVLHPEETQNKTIYLAGDTVSWDDIAKICEKLSGSKFERKVVDIKQLREKLKEYKDFFDLRRVACASTIIVSGQKGVWWDKNETWNAKYHPEYKTTSVEEFLKKYATF